MAVYGRGRRDHRVDVVTNFSEIRELMLRAGFRTQRELAETIDWSEEHISRIMCGKHPESRLLRLYLEALARERALSPPNPPRYARR